jgi:diketogulonate reductase-like aldo/keto reductase
MQTISTGGANIPALGFGTYRMNGQEVREMVPHALAAGFRHFDTAQFYGTEADLGAALHQSGIARSELFLTTKVWVANYDSAKFARSVDESLNKLQTNYVDLLLLHWPSKDVPLATQVAGLEAAKRNGATHHIGVSNFTIDLVNRARNLAQSPIVTNQVEYHPFLDQSKLISAMRADNIALTAYYGMADGRVFSDPNIIFIARLHGKTPAQVVLRWLVQQNIAALTKTSKPSRAAENANIFDFELPVDEVERIGQLARPNGRLVNPPELAPSWDT